MEFSCDPAKFEENIVNPAILRSHGVYYIFFDFRIIAEKNPQARVFIVFFFFVIVFVQIQVHKIVLREYRSRCVAS